VTDIKYDGNKTARDRKYKVFWGAFIITTILLVFQKITGDQWVAMAGTEFMAYMAGNVGAHFSKRGNGDVESSI